MAPVPPPLPEEVSCAEIALPKDGIGRVEVYLHTSYQGRLIPRMPWAEVSWQRHRIYFADREEWHAFLLNRWRVLMVLDPKLCPVCGGRLKNLRRVFSAGAGLPFDPHFCSAGCEEVFLARLGLYRELRPDCFSHVEKEESLFSLWRM